MDYRQKYAAWLNFQELDEELVKELAAIKGNKQEIEGRFYKELEFGTGGLRGIIGAGTNRMNIYTVRKATQGLANYLQKTVADWANNQKLQVVIAYDSRHQSKEFALEAGLVLAHNNIKAYIFPQLTATPVLSFAVRELKAAAGIVITASHNPPEYNGYKVYDADGGQITDAAAAEITAEISSVSDELRVPVMSFPEAQATGSLQLLGAGEQVMERYMDCLRELSLNRQLIKEKSKDFKVVYSPLHGTGYRPVIGILTELGFQDVTVVPEQAEPDANFSTVKYPNPEEREAFHLAIQLGKELGADLLMATDPDADRLGVAVKNEQGEYVILTGNQLGALLLEYILSQRQEQGRLPADGAVIKTIVTSEIGRTIAADYGLDTIDTLTGFKYIGEKIKEFRDTGTRQFLFGYEESYGYLAGDFVRDKDAVQACMLAAEMTLYYKTKGLSLYQKLEQIFAKYGYYREELASFTLAGKEGQEQIADIMNTFRREGIAQIAGEKVVEAYDYLNKSSTGLPPANVLKYVLADNSWFCIRPSGTEPKIKIYFGVVESSAGEAVAKLTKLKEAVLSLLEKFKAVKQ